MSFETRLRVRYAETDAMGFVYHSNYFVWFEVARTEMMRRLNRSYRDLEQEGLLLPAVQADCRFLNPAHYDDELRIVTDYVPEDGPRLHFRYQVYRDCDQALIAEGFTIHVCIGRSGAIRRHATTELKQLLLEGRESSVSEESPLCPPGAQ